MFTAILATTAAATGAFQFNTSFFLGLALVISEYLGTNDKLKTNSILQMIIFALRTFGVKKNANNQ